MSSLGHHPLSTFPISAIQQAAVAAEDFLLGIEDGSQDVAIYEVYSATVDYSGWVNEPLSDDAAPADMPDAIVTVDDPIIEIVRDWSDWSDAQAPPIADSENFLFDSLWNDEPDWTDLRDYAWQCDPLPDDTQDFLPVAVEEAREYDFTDFADYSWQTDPLADDSVDFALAAEWSDEPDYVDFGDYSFASDPVGEDAAPDDPLLGCSVDEPEPADLFEYGWQVDVAADDAVSDDPIGSDQSDEVHQADGYEYGFASDPVADADAVEDAILGIEDGSSDPDWTDVTEYGSISEPLSDDAPTITPPLLVEGGWIPRRERKKKRRKDYVPLRDELERWFRRARGELDDDPAKVLADAQADADEKAAARAVALVAPFMVAERINWEALMDEARTLRRVQQAIADYRAAIEDEEDEDDLLLSL